MTDRAVFLTGGSRPQPIRGLAYPEDEFVPGAVTLALSDKQPHVGMIIRVEQRSWNALTRTWDKTVVVGFGSQEVLINPCTTCERSRATPSAARHCACYCRFPRLSLWRVRCGRNSARPFSTKQKSASPTGHMHRTTCAVVTATPLVIMSTADTTEPTIISVQRAIWDGCRLRLDVEH